VKTNDQTYRGDMRTKKEGIETWGDEEKPRTWGGMKKISLKEPWYFRVV